jgi:hypothetical protein
MRLKEFRLASPEVNNADDFVELSEAIETLSASAFNAIIKYLHNDVRLTLPSP